MVTEKKTWIQPVSGIAGITEDKCYITIQKEHLQILASYAVAASSLLPPKCISNQNNPRLVQSTHRRYQGTCKVFLSWIRESLPYWENKKNIYDQRDIFTSINQHQDACRLKHVAINQATATHSLALSVGNNTGRQRKKETHKAGSMCIQHGKDEHAVNLESLAATCICGQTWGTDEPAVVMSLGKAWTSD